MSQAGGTSRKNRRGGGLSRYIGGLGYEEEEASIGGGVGGGDDAYTGVKRKTKRSMLLLSG